MNWVLLQTNQQPYLPPPPPPLSSNLGSSSAFSLNNKVSPSILLIIIVLAIIFFISGLLHLLIRFMLRPPTRDPDDFDNVTALQGQLQQLFTLHDAGVDQSFIDTLPVFNYKSIIGVKDPFDCAVCLYEFEAEDKLRLLPKCSHAFHMECIDTWLLSHSTCPLCRGNLIPDFPSNSSCSPIVLVLESGSESSREIVADNSSNSIQRANSQLGVRCDEEFENLSTKPCEIKGKEEENKEKVVTIKLGKFKNVDGGGEGSSGNNIDGRRCFSMGSFEYVMDENSSLQVPIRTPVRKQSSKKSSLPLTPGHRVAMSECGGSRREFNGFEAFKSIDIGGGGNNSGIITSGDNAIGKSKRESLSVSKIWLRGKKDKPNSTTTESSSSRRSFSFRFPIHRNNAGGGGADELKGKNGGSVSRRTISEVDMARWENGVGRSSELGIDEENQSCYSLDSHANPPSFARRTLLLLMGRQNKELQKELNTEKNYNVYAFHVLVLVFQGLLLGVGNLIILYTAGASLFAYY